MPTKIHQGFIEVKTWSKRESICSMEAEGKHLRQKLLIEDSSVTPSSIETEEKRSGIVRSSGDV